MSTTFAGIPIDELSTLAQEYRFVKAEATSPTTLVVYDRTNRKHTVYASFECKLQSDGTIQCWLNRSQYNKSQTMMFAFIRALSDQYGLRRVET